ncbi:hypothetical protein SAMN04487761_1693 [Lachnospiraceae bacterium C7]|nr:hypothetical protein SAMN04487761_1693 [Lachnospiraceae bacterium C7]
MYEKVAKLLMYGDLDESSLLYQFAHIFKNYKSSQYKNEKYNKVELIREINSAIKRLLEIATKYGFDENLWHNYLTYYLITSENPFSITCEKIGANEGSVNEIVSADLGIFLELFNYNFEEIEKDLGLTCFSQIANYKAIEKKELMYNKSVSERVQTYSRKLEKAKTKSEFFDIITEFYQKYGVGMLGLNKAFRIVETANNGSTIGNAIASFRNVDFSRNTSGLENVNHSGDTSFSINTGYSMNTNFLGNLNRIKLIPINNLDNVALSDLVGYERQKKKLIDNTEAFLKGKKANNVLLFGDSGTGKSTCIKAIINKYYDQGLRMIEIYKHQFRYLSELIEMIKNRNYKFIIYMDDLSFEEFEIEYKFLKAVIEGGVETKPENILIYATSNRRHLIKETWNDRNDMDNTLGKHKSDTIEEKLSLVNRFGVTISFSKPSPKEYIEIVLELAKRQNISLDEETIKKEANKWEISHGGISGRTAQQFVNYLESQI